ncbi:MAG: thioredoxin domain-containing protein, partial [Alphaproteobacteria bacterium]
MHNRRHITSAIAAVGLMLLVGCKGASSPVTTNDVTLGKDNAPVTVIEYASLSCPFCAKFNNDNFANFKKTYIDTGQVKFVQREMLLHNPQLSAAGFLLARCAGKDKYFQVTDGIYKADQQMDETGQYREGLLKVARSVGFNEAQLDACIQDDKAIEALNARV